MTKIFKFKTIILLSVFYFLLFVLPTQAARLYFQPQEAVIGSEKEFSVAVNVDAGKSINAIQAVISVPKELTPVDITEGNSIITFWVEKPNFDESSRLLTFSGIIPGGFQEEKASLLIVKFKTTKEQEGKAVLTFNKEKTKIYLHTSEGVEDSLELETLALLVVDGQENFGVEVIDRDPPEDFKPEISRDANIFENRWFLVFATQDKGLGIDYYKVCEKSKTKCAPAESPHLLQNQKLNKKIFVKAVDKSGNERVAVLLPQKPSPWYQNYWIIGIIVLVVIAIARRRLKIL